MKSLKNKNGKAGIRRATLRIFAVALALCAAIFVGSGCKSWDHPGETRAEVSRRHDRVLRLNQQTMLADIDKALLLDKPSLLTDKRVP
jgi:hypothetical protein